MKQASSRWPVRVVACALLALGGTAWAQEEEEEFSRPSKRRGEGRDDSEQIEQRRRWFIESRGLDRQPNAGAERARAARELKEQVRARAMQFGPGEVWQPLGPSSMNMGTWVMGRVSGRTNVIVPHPTDDNTVYFGAAAGGVWKTTDAGVTWTPLFDQVGTLPIGSIFVEPSTPNNVWVGTGDKNGGDCAGYFGQGVFLSQDGGSTWAARNGTGATAMPLSVVNAVAVQPTNTNVVLAGGSGTCNGTGPSLSGPGMFRSTDRGATWARVLNVTVEDIVFVPGSATVYASAPNSGVYKSTDGGATWTLAINGMNPSGVRMRLAMAPSNSNILYVLIGRDPNRSDVYRTTDGAATWSLRKNAACDVDEQCHYNQAIAVHPTNPDTILMGAIGPAMSTDGGATYTFLTDSWGSTQQVHQDIHVVLFSKTNGNRFWIGSDGGLWRTDDNGVNFTNMNSNLNVTQFYDIAVHPSNSDIVFGGAQDNSSSSRGASHVWDLTVPTGDGGMNALDPANPNIVFQATYPLLDPPLRLREYPQILRSTTGGGANSFNYLEKTGIAHTARLPWVTPMAVTSNFIFVATDIVYRGVTSASPMSWTDISGNIGHVSVITPMQQGAMIPTFVGTAAGKIYYSADAAILNPIFTDVTGNYPGGTVSDVAMTPGNPQRVFITRSGFGASRLYRSTTGGTTWTAVGSGLPNVPANTVAIDPVNTQRIFVGTDVGVYESIDGGDTFFAFSLGLPLGVVVMDLEVDDMPHFLHAGTYGRGAWKVALQGGTTDPGGMNFTYTASNTHGATQNTANKVIALTAGQVLTLGTCGVTGASFSGDTLLRLFNPGGVEVTSSDDACGGQGSNFTYTVPVAAGGDYELRAGCYSSSSCSGTVAWTLTAGGGGGGGTPSNGSFAYNASNTASATQNTTNQNVTAAAAQVITVGTCDMAGASSTGDTYLRLMSPSGAEVASNDDACGGPSSKLTYTVPAGKSGTYVIRAGCYSSNTCGGTVVWTVQ